jgi:ubiquitin-conjugating enzyme E2 D
MNNINPIKRLKKEFEELEKDPPHNCSAGPKNDNLYEWEATIIGPEKTPYENGIFKLLINIPDKYPISPPKITFITRIYHPNINKFGNICLDILQKNWSPALSISKILLCISSLLSDPNPKDPLDSEAARLYERDIEEFNQMARAFTIKHCENLQ